MKHSIALFILFAWGTWRCAAFSAPVELLAPADVPQTAVAAITAAKSKIRVAAYTLTDKTIFEALAGAAGRGVDVQVILDGNYGLRTSEKAITALRGAHIFVFADHAHQPRGIMHIKLIWIDGKIAIAGSYNYTAQAGKWNAEAPLLIQDASCLEALNALWNTHRLHSNALP